MKRILLVIGLLALVGAGCTDNVRSKVWGGNMEIAVPSGNKLVVVTWKDAELWYLYRPMRTNEVPETSTFQEKSSLGLIEGSVTFVESR